MNTNDRTMYNCYFPCSMKALLLTAAIIVYCEISCSKGQTPQLPDGPQLALLVDPCSTGVMQHGTGQTWTDNVIPYTFKNGLSRSMSTAVQQSMYLIESKTCLRYVSHTNQQDYLEIQHNLKCCSHGGRVGYGLHHLYLHESCSTGEQLNSIIARTGLVDWELQTAPRECGCGGSVYVDHPSEDSINSPGYPLDYTTSTQCVWKLWIASGTTVELEVINFELEHDFGCNYDYLEFIKQSESGELESLPFKRCGNDIDKKFNFTSGSLTLRFVSDMDIQAKGFKIKYKTYNDKDSQILCSEFNGGCSQLCISDENGVKQQCSCEPGYGLQPDGKTCQDINECSVQKGGCDQRCRNTEGSYYCHCNLQYGLAKEDAKKCEVCGGSFSGIAGGFSSPQYPTFSPLQNCQWIINLLPNHFLKVFITNFSIPISKRCVDNYLKAQHGSFSFKKRICGTFTGIKYIIKEAIGSRTYFRFRTGISDFTEYSGFTLTYEQVPTTKLTQQELDTVYVNDVAIPYETNNWLS